MNAKLGRKSCKHKGNMPTNSSVIYPKYEERVSHAAVIVQVTSLVVIMTVALLGNSLVVYVIWKHQIMRNKTWHYLLSLSASDFSASLLAIPVMIAATLNEDVLNNRLLCQFNGFCLVLFFVSSLAILAVISFHKYINIAFPLRRFSAKKNSVYFIAGVWFISFLLALGPILGWSSYLHLPGRQQCVITVNTKADRGYLLTLMSAGFVLPFLTMVFCYYKVYDETKRHARRMEKSAIKGGNVVSDSRVFRTVIIIVASFLFCWLPFFIYMCYGISRRPVPPSLSAYAFIFGFTHSALNPVVYALRHDVFLEGFKSVLCCTKFVILDVADAIQNSDTTTRLPNCSFFVPGFVDVTTLQYSNPIFFRRGDAFQGDCNSIQFSRMVNDAYEGDYGTLQNAEDRQVISITGDSPRSYVNPSFSPNESISEGYSSFDWNSSSSLPAPLAQEVGIRTCLPVYGSSTLCRTSYDTRM